MWTLAHELTHLQDWYQYNRGAESLARLFPQWLDAYSDAKLKERERVGECYYCDMFEWKAIQWARFVARELRNKGVCEPSPKTK